MRGTPAVITFFKSLLVISVKKFSVASIGSVH